MHAGELKIPLRYECNVRCDHRCSLYSYINKQLAASKQEITSQAAKTKLYVRSALIQQPETEKMQLNKKRNSAKIIKLCFIKLRTLTVAALVKSGVRFFYVTHVVHSPTINTSTKNAPN